MSYLNLNHLITENPSSEISCPAESSGNDLNGRWGQMEIPCIGKQVAIWCKGFSFVVCSMGILLHCTGLYRCSKHFLIRAGDADPILRRHVNPFLAILAVIDLIRWHPG